MVVLGVSAASDWLCGYHGAFMDGDLAFSEFTPAMPASERSRQLVGKRNAVGWAHLDLVDMTLDLGETKVIDTIAIPAASSSSVIVSIREALRLSRSSFVTTRGADEPFKRNRPEKHRNRNKGYK